MAVPKNIHHESSRLVPRRHILDGRGSESGAIRSRKRSAAGTCLGAFFLPLLRTEPAQRDRAHGSTGPGREGMRPRRPRSSRRSLDKAGTEG